METECTAKERNSLSLGTSLGVHWVRSLVQGIRVQSLVRELRSHTPCMVQPKNKKTLTNNKFSHLKTFKKHPDYSCGVEHDCKATPESPRRACYSSPFGRKTGPLSLNSLSAVSVISDSLRPRGL